MENRSVPAIESLPTGTVTFLFTDIEGSTNLAKQHSQVLPTLLARHNDILRQSIEEYGGFVFRTVGDAFCAAFHTAPDALNAALMAQRSLQNEAWDPIPVHVRMGIHTGAALAGVLEDRLFDDRSYLTLARVQSIMSSAAGGQVLISGTSAGLERDHLPVGVSLLDMGEHQLRTGLDREHLWQVLADDLRSDFPPLKTLSLPPNNLPLQLNPFFGRERELVQVRELLESTRLLTITGPGGIGKTRLALQTAESLLPDYSQGVWFVPLDPLSSAEFLPEAIGTALGLSFSGQVPAREHLLESLRQKNMLLVLDNFEHLLPNGAHLLTEILQRAPEVKLLVTSRERLNLQVEWILDLNGLEYPQVGENESLAAYPAAELFLQHARRATGRPLPGEEGGCVAQITRLVEGVPLALELAAGWARALTCREIADEIQRGLDFLQARHPDFPERHRSMRAIFDHSWKLISAEEKVVFRRLSVFRGGFDRESAREVAGASLSVLADLVDKSLVQHQVDGRYRVHELLRQFGAAELEGAGESAKTRERHLAYFLKLAERSKSQEPASQEKAWLDRLEREIDNLRAALDWSLSPHCELGVQAGLSLVVFVRDLWVIRMKFTEGVEWLDLLLAHPQAREYPRDYANALRVAAFLHEWGTGKIITAQKEYEQSLEIAKAEGDPLLLAHILSDFGNFWNSQEEMEKAQEHLERSLALFREVEDEPGIAEVLRRLGHVQHSRNDRPAARSYYHQSLQAWKAIGNRAEIAVTLNELGSSYFSTGQYPEARAFLEESLAIGQELVHKFVVINCSFELGLIEFLEGDVPRSIAYLEENLSLARNTDMKGMIALNLGALGDIHRYHYKDIPKAQAFYEEGLGIIRETEYTTAWFHLRLLLSEGFLSLGSGDVARARGFLKEILNFHMRHLDDPASIALFLIAAAGFSASSGSAEKAAWWLGIAQAVFETDPPLKMENWWFFPDYEFSVSLTRSQLDEETFDRLIQEGRAAGMGGHEQAFAEVQEFLK